MRLVPVLRLRRRVRRLPRYPVGLFPYINCQRQSDHGVYTQSYWFAPEGWEPDGPLLYYAVDPSEAAQQ